MAVWKFVYWLIFAIGVSALAGSFLGAVHPAGDSLAVIRNYLAGAGALWILLGWATRVASPVWLGLVGLAALPALAGYTRYEFVSPPPGVTTIYQKNVMFRHRDTAALAEDIRAIAPDLLTLQEMTDRQAGLLEDLDDILPYQHVCEYRAVGASVVASRWPVVPDSQICRLGFAAMQVDSPDGPLWVASMHLFWPWPEGQVQHLDKLLPVMESLDGPVVLGGDFNMVPWSSTMRRTTAALGAERAGKVRLTFSLTHDGLPGIERFVALPIDHVLIPAGKRGATEVRPLLGSDHHGLVARY